MDEPELRSQAELFERIVAEQPAFAYAWFLLGDFRERLGERDAAIAAFRRARDLDPTDVCGASLRLARLGAEAVAAMPEAYVRGVFDQYAARFDEAVGRGLAYRAPALLRAGVERVCAAAGRPARFANALDLGCGTGLAGEALRPLAARLVGIDLSPAMAAAAREKNCYDRIEVGDIARFLAGGAGGEAPFDLIVAADVLVYVGDLAPVIAAAAGVLAPSGLIAFTVETHAGDGVALGDQLRFVHGAPHVAAALASAGLRIVELGAASTRNESGVPVPGLLAVAAK